MFEEIYGQSCNNPNSWSYLVKKVLIGQDMLENMEQEMKII